MAQTAIEWTSYLDSLGVSVRGYTFNAWLGCDKVSPACRICYITRTPALRTRGMKHGDPRQRTVESTWKQPLAWNRKAAREGVRPRVFTNSLADWLDDKVPIEWLADLLGLIAATPHLDWLLLTKRPENWIPRMMEVERSERAKSPILALTPGAMLAHDWLNGFPPENVWLGVTVEDQKRADERIPVLLSISAVVRFLSMEPLLSFVDIGLRSASWTGCAADYTSRWVRLTQTVRSDFVGIMPHEAARTAAPGIYRARANKHGALSVMTPGGELGIKPGEFEVLPGIDWVIAGGESGDKDDEPTPSHPAWFRDVLRQCRDATTPFFFKQRGDWSWPEGNEHIADMQPDEMPDFDTELTADWRNHPERVRCIRTDGTLTTGYDGHGSEFVVRVGKVKAGHHLDGKIYHEFPHAIKQ